MGSRPTDVIGGTLGAWDYTIPVVDPRTTPSPTDPPGATPSPTGKGEGGRHATGAGTPGEHTLRGRGFDGSADPP
jgi:hypothetical protein